MDPGFVADTCYNTMIRIICFVQPHTLALDVLQWARTVAARPPPAAHRSSLKQWKAVRT